MEEEKEMKERKSRKLIFVLLGIALALAGAVSFFAVQSLQGKEKRVLVVKVLDCNMTHYKGLLLFITVSVKQGNRTYAAGYPLFPGSKIDEVRLNETWKGEFTVVLELWSARGGGGFPPKWLVGVGPVLNYQVYGPGGKLIKTVEKNKIFLKISPGSTEKIRIVGWWLPDYMGWVEIEISS